MDRETFRMKKEQIQSLSLEIQKQFYLDVIHSEVGTTTVKLLAYFDYACLYYYDGDFRKARKILEPLIIDYQSYEYVPELVSCLNFMGACSQCECEYVLSRYYYRLAYKVVKEQDEKRYISYVYNNIALTYIFENHFDLALENILLAEKYLAYTDEKMASCIYLNKTDIYCHLHQLDEALKMYNVALKKYNCSYYLPEDTSIVGLELYFRRNEKEKYKKLLSTVLDHLDRMSASEFIDACNTAFQCALLEEDYPVIETLIGKMDAYMKNHPKENKVGLNFEDLKYQYAKKIGNTKMALKALEDKEYYYAQIVSIMEHQRTTTLDEYMDMQHDLHQTMESEKKANQAKTRFLANMSHDIRTPMNTIVGITDLMEHSIENPKEMKEYLHQIEQSSKHMLELLNDLLDMSRIETGKIVIRNAPVQMIDLIDEIESMIRMQTKEKVQTFSVSFENIEHNDLITDSLRLQRILMNVLSNSVKYTPENGKVALKIKEISNNENSAQFEFIVSDNGMGMTPEVINHIFEPFERGTESIVNTIQGSGLGMAITKSIVDAMQGVIEIESHKNRGTETKITLSCQINDQAKKESFLFVGYTSQEQERIQKDIFFGKCLFTKQYENRTTDVVVFKHPQKSLPFPFMCMENVFSNLAFKRMLANVKYTKGPEKSGSILKGMCFLCAEDNALNAQIMSSLLKLKEARCVVCKDGRQLVEQFENVQEGQYDAILMDIQMPKMNGYQATKAIRLGKNPLGKTIPIIAMSANAYVEDMEKAYDAGMDGYISKPVNLETLENTIRKILTKKDK